MRSALIFALFFLPIAGWAGFPAPVWTTDNTVAVHYDPKPVYAAIKNVLRSAQKSICFDFYIFYGPDADEMADIMIAKAAQGVDVRILLDPDMGTFGKMHSLGKRVYQRLRKAQSDHLAIYFSATHLLPKQMRNVDHNKIVIVDDRVAMTGGMNIGIHFQRYHDNMVEVRGPVVAQARYWFDHNFAEAKRETAKKTKTRVHPSHPWIASDRQQVEALVLANQGKDSSAVRWIDNGVGRAFAYQAILRRIEEAQQSIDLQMSEFQGTEYIGALIAAKKRGVRVRALIDADDNISEFAPVGKLFDGIINAKSVSDLLDAGVDVRFFDFREKYSRSHAKVSIFDGKVVSIGASNWASSTWGYFESNFEIIGGQGYRIIQAKFDEFWAGAPKAHKPNGFVRELNRLAYALGVFGHGPLAKNGAVPTWEEDEFLAKFSDSERSLLQRQMSSVSELPVQ